MLSDGRPIECAGSVANAANHNPDPPTPTPTLAQVSGEDGAPVGTRLACSSHDWWVKGVMGDGSLLLSKGEGYTVTNAQVAIVEAAPAGSAPGV